MKKNKEPLTPTLHHEQTEIVLSYLLFRKMDKLFNAFQHHIRLAIAEQLLQEKSLNVTDLCIRLRSEQSFMSQHLALMRRSKVVVATRQGQQVYYSLNQERLQLLNEMLAALNPFYQHTANLDNGNKLYNLYFFHTAYELNRALYHVDRIKILAFLHQQPNCCVQDIYKGLGFEQSPTSQQLRVLRLNRLVNNQRSGKHIYYNINYPLLKTYVQQAQLLFPPEQI